MGGTVTIENTIEVERELRRVLSRARRLKTPYLRAKQLHDDIATLSLPDKEHRALADAWQTIHDSCGRYEVAVRAAQDALKNEVNTLKSMGFVRLAVNRRKRAARRREREKKLRAKAARAAAASGRRIRVRE